MVTHPESQRERQAACATPSVTDSGVFEVPLFIEPLQGLVNCLLVPSPNVQLHLLSAESRSTITAGKSAANSVCTTRGEKEESRRRTP